MGVRFKFCLNRSSDDAYRIQMLYDKKWSDFKKWLFSQKRTRDVYIRMAQWRKEVPEDTFEEMLVTDAESGEQSTEFKFTPSFISHDLIESLSQVNPEGLDQLTKVNVYFDALPYDMRIYVLSILGLKVQDFKTSLSKI